MPSTGTIPLVNPAPDDLITSAGWIAEFENIDTLFTPSGLDDYSVSDAQMQIQTAPYPGSVLSKPTSTAGELERIRYQIAQIIGEDFWYKTVAANLKSGGIVPIGSVVDYPSATPANANWHLADGTAISRTAYATLFALVGTTFGAGDAATTFNLPNYTDRMTITAGNLYAVGSIGGAVSSTPAVAVTDLGHNHVQDAHTHTMGNHTHTTPVHTHVLADAAGVANAIGGNAVIKTAGALRVAGASAGTLNQASFTTDSGGNGTSGVPSTNTTDASTPTNNANTTGITASLGSGIATLPPYLGMYKMIRVL